MLDIFRGLRPDITPAQIIAGIPIIAELLHSFNLYTLTAPQQDSLSKAVTWGFVLIGGDAAIRIGRNVAAARNPGIVAPPIDYPTPDEIEGADGLGAPLTDDEINESRELERSAPEIDQQDTPQPKE